MRRTARPLPLTAALALIAFARAAAAPPLPPLPPAAPPRAEAAPLPPYQDRLDRLAELLGVLSTMRSLCGEGPDWREKMTILLDAEGVTEARRARLAGRFNRGLSGYALSYRRCTPAARLVTARALAEGSRLSGSLSRLFSPD